MGCRTVIADDVQIGRILKGVCVDAGDISADGDLVEIGAGCKGILVQAVDAGGNGDVLQQRAVEGILTDGSHSGGNVGDGQSRTALEGILADGTQIIRQDQIFQRAAVLECIITDGMHIAKIHTAQVGTAVESLVADGGNAVRQGDGDQIGISRKGIGGDGGDAIRHIQSGQTGTTVKDVAIAVKGAIRISNAAGPAGRQDNIAQTAAVIEGAVTDGRNLVGQHQRREIGAALHGKITDGFKVGGERQTGQATAVFQCITVQRMYACGENQTAQTGTAFNCSFADRFYGIRDLQLLKGRTLVKRMVGDIRDTFGQINVLQTLAICKGISRQSRNPFGHRYRFQRGTALESCAVTGVGTLRISGAGGPGHGNVDLSQCSTVLEGTVSQLGNAVCKLDFLKCRAVAECVSAQRIQTFVHGNGSQTAAGVKSKVIDGSKACGEVQARKGSTAQEGAFGNGLQLFGEGDACQSGASVQCTDTDGGQSRRQIYILKLGTAIQCVRRQDHQTFGDGDTGQAGAVFKEMAVAGESAVRITGTAVPAYGNVDLRKGGIIQKDLIAQRGQRVGQRNGSQCRAVCKNPVLQIGYAVGEGDLAQSGTAAECRAVNGLQSAAKANIGQSSTVLEGTFMDHGQRIGQDYRGQSGISLKDACCNAVDRIAVDHSGNDQRGIRAGIPGDLDKAAAGDLISEVRCSAFYRRNTAGNRLHSGQHHGSAGHHNADPVLFDGIVGAIEADHIGHTLFGFLKAPVALCIGCAHCHSGGFFHTIDTHRNTGSTGTGLGQDLTTQTQEVMIQAACSKGDIVGIGIAFCVGTCIAVNGQLAAAVHGSCIDFGRALFDPEHFQIAAVQECIGTDLGNAVGKDHSAQAGAGAEGIGGNDGCSVGDLHSCKGAAAFENTTIIAGCTVGINRTCRPAGGQGYLAQTAAVIECMIADAGNAVGKCKLGQTGTAAKSKTVDESQVFGKRNALKTGAVFKGRDTHRSNIVGDCEGDQRSAAGKGIVLDRGNRFEDGDFFQRSTVPERIVGDDGKMLGQVNVLQTFAICKGISRQSRNPFGHRYRFQRGTALESCAVTGVGTLRISGAGGPGHGNVDLSQCSTVLEGTVSQLGNAVCKLDFLKCRAVAECVSAQRIQTFVHGNGSQTAAGVKSKVIDGSKACGEVQARKGSTAQEGAFGNGLQLFGEGDACQSGASVQCTDTDGGQSRRQIYILKLGTAIQCVRRQDHQTFGDGDTGQAGAVFKEMAVAGESAVRITGTAVPAYGNVDLRKGGIIQKDLIAQRGQRVGQRNGSQCRAVCKNPVLQIGYAVGEGDLAQSGTAAECRAVNGLQSAAKANIGQSSTVLEGTFMDHGQRIGQDYRGQSGISLKDACCNAVDRIAVDHSGNDQRGIRAGIPGDLDKAAAGNLISKIRPGTFGIRDRLFGSKVHFGTAVQGIQRDLIIKNSIGTVASYTVIMSGRYIGNAPASVFQRGNRCKDIAFSDVIQHDGNAGQSIAICILYSAGEGDVGVTAQRQRGEWNVMGSGKGLGKRALIAVDGQIAAACKCRVGNGIHTGIHPNTAQGRTVFKGIVADGDQSRGQGDRTKAGTVAQSAGRQIHNAFGQIQTDKLCTAFKNVTIVAGCAVGINRTFTPAGRQCNILQTAAVIKCTVADAGNTVGD